MISKFGMDSDNINNDDCYNNRDHIEIEMKDVDQMGDYADDSQINDHLNGDRIREFAGDFSTDFRQESNNSNYRLIGKFIFNVMFIAILMLICVAIGVGIGIGFNAFSHKYGLI